MTGKPTIRGQGIAVRSQTDTGQSSNCFAGVTVQRDGAWLISYRAGRQKVGFDQRPMLVRSSDGGATWSTPVAPFEPPILDGKPGSLHGATCSSLSDGRLAAVLRWVDGSDTSKPWFNPATQGLLDTRILLVFSSDDGRSWSAPILVDTGPYARVPVSHTGPLRILSDGRHVIPFETNKPYDEAGPWLHVPALAVSADGHRWDEVVEVQRHPSNAIYYWDHRPSVLPDGTMIDVFWTYDVLRNAYLNAHASRSVDHGRTWSEAFDTGVPGAPGPLVALSNGQLLMTFVDRTGSPQIKARLSDDGGRTWAAETEIVIRRPELSRQIADKRSTSQAWSEMERFSIGLPDATSLPTGEALITYYVGPDADHTDIEWAVVGIG